jgi:membrane protease subunit HflK
MPWNDQTGGPSGGGSDSKSNSQDGGRSGGPSGGPWGAGGPRKPWGQQPPPRPPQGGPQGPDLEELMREWNERFRAMFGGGAGGGGGRRGGEGRKGGAFGWPLIAGLVVIGWLLTGVYTVDEGEQAVILTLGKYSRTTGPGIHLHLPTPIEERIVRNVTGQRAADIGFTQRGDEPVDVPEQSLMITGDRNIAEVHFRIFYTVSDLRQFAFSVRDPDETVRAVAESSMREVIGRRNLEPITTTERPQIEAEVEELMTQVLDEYQIGVSLRQVEMRSARWPQEVIGAFNDVINARQEAETATNNANRDTAQIVNEAEAYREQTIRDATGEAQRFLAVYEQYRQAPQVTRDRLYLETMEKVYLQGNLMILDQRGGAVPYLPLDSMVRRAPSASAQQGGQ